jgi:hypothetical protein
MSLPPSVKRSLLFGRHPSQPHELVRVENAMAKLVDDEIPCAGVSLFEPFIGTFRREDFEDITSAVEPRVPLGVLKGNDAATQRYLDAIATTNADFVEIFE